MNYSEVSRSVTTSIVDFHAELGFRCSKTTRSMTTMTARSSTVRGETRMETIPTLETTVLRLLKPKHQLTAGTLETAARALSRPHTATLLEERQRQLSVTSMVMPVVRLLNRRTRTRKLCKRTTLPISRRFRTETAARDGIATWTTTKRMNPQRRKFIWMTKTTSPRRNEECSYEQPALYAQIAFAVHHICLHHSGTKPLPRALLVLSGCASACRCISIWRILIHLSRSSYITKSRSIMYT